jgi:hypothetical protein
LSVVDHIGGATANTVGGLFVTLSHYSSKSPVMHSCLCLWYGPALKSFVADKTR